MQENLKKKCKSIYNLTLLFFIPFQLKLRKEMNLNKSISYFTFSVQPQYFQHKEISLPNNRKRLLSYNLQLLKKSRTHPTNLTAIF